MLGRMGMHLQSANGSVILGLIAPLCVAKGPVDQCLPIRGENFTQAFL